MIKAYLCTSDPVCPSGAHPSSSFFDKCQTITRLYIFNKLLYIVLLYISRLSLPLFFLEWTNKPTQRTGRDIHSNFVIYLQFRSYSIDSRIRLKVKRPRLPISSAFKKKNRRRCIILPDMVNLTKEKQHCFDDVCVCDCY
jgi:hypothetical protein